MSQFKTLYTNAPDTANRADILRAAPPSLDMVILQTASHRHFQDELADAIFWISHGSAPIDDDLLTVAHRLKLIQHVGRLTDHIDIDGVKGRRIYLAGLQVPAYAAAAEHILMQMLSLARRARLTESVVLQASPAWGDSKRGVGAPNWSGQRLIQTVYGSTVGMLGFGEVGAELAERLQTWGCTLLYHQKTQLPRHIEDQLGLFYTHPPTLYRKSDFLINLLPYQPETEYCLNADVFSQMKTNSYLISIAGGGVIQENHLSDTIRQAGIRGAALDRFDWEPIRPDNPLLALVREGYNVLLTPHIAAIPDDPHTLHYKFDNIRRFLSDEPLNLEVT